MGVHLELTIGPATAPAHELNITVNLGALSPRGCTANPLPTLFDALAIAAHKHCDQRRKDADATPYINHPIALAHPQRRGRHRRPSGADRSHPA